MLISPCYDYYVLESQYGLFSLSDESRVNQMHFNRTMPYQHMSHSSPLSRKISMPSRVCITVLLLFLVQAAHISAQESSIRVMVLDDYTQIPISSALVTVSSGGDVIGTEYTGDDGIATIQITETHSPEPEKLPSSITLSQNYPNPFQSDTRVEIGVPEEQTITATVFNILGQRVAYHQIPISAGFHSLELSLSHLATGVYFLRIDGRSSETVKLFKMGSGFHQSGPSFSVSPGRASNITRVHSVTGGEYTIRVEKERHDVFQTTLPVAGSHTISAPLSRNNMVEIQVVDEDDNPVDKDLSIRSTGFSSNISTPLSLTLKSGIYKTSGEIEDGISLEKSFEIASRDTTIVLTFEEAGVLLEGDPAAPAVASNYNLYIPLVYSPEMISADPELLSGGEVLRTEIQVALAPGATVGQTNDFLEKYNARIVSMFENNTVYIIRVPDPGDIAASNQLLVEMQIEQIVLLASKSVVMEDPMPEEPELQETEELQDIPDHIDISSNSGWIDHHLAARAHAAWNVRDMITDYDNRPWILIGDLFGDGAPGAGYDADFESDDFGEGNIHSHGYHVLGIIAGSHVSYVEISSDQNGVTGIFRERLRVRAADLQAVDNLTWPRYMALLVDRMHQILEEDEHARIIMSTSLNSRSLPDQTDSAIFWTLIIRGFFDLFTPESGLENRIIHFTSAGNVSGGVRLDAADNSLFAYAALGEMSIDGSTIPNLMNTFVVENRVNTLHQDSNRRRPLPGCAVNSSIMGGNLSAMGTNVYSFGECVQRDVIGSCTQHASDSNTSFMTGTSMATPQAAGLAAFAWSVNPDLSVQEVMQIIRETTEERPTSTESSPGRACNQVIPQPVINAYGAVLAAGGQPALRALLDVSRDGMFDETDIGIYLEEFASRDGELDYSRFDLNGDGITGGNRWDQFDLDMDYEHSYLNFDVEGISVLVDENRLSDLNILCYYAYSDLYQGNTDTHRTLLEQLCLEPERPLVETTDVTRLTQTSMILGGMVLSDDRSQVTELGVVWHTSSFPTLLNNKVVSGSETGSFTSSISGLQPGRTYYVRAYALNEAGPGYGQEIIVKTPDDRHDNETGTVSDIDGNVYKTFKILNDWWMAENLRTTRYRNGDEIPNITNGDDWANHTEGAWVNYGNNPDNDNLYGKLYNWYAGDDPRGLCPEGWSVSSTLEWDRLANAVGGNSQGFKMKSTRSDPDPQPRWTSPNVGATNESGFTGYPGGSMGFTGLFSNLGNYGFWWSSSPSALENAADYYYLFHNDGNIVRTYSDFRTAFSVRCVMN